MSEEATPKEDAAAIGPAIPSHINELGRFEAAQYYVEALGWAIQPLYGPTQGRGRERGKKAVLKGWKHHTLEDATPEFIARYFGGKKEYNLGCAIDGDFVHVDLDSKADKGASVMEWLAGVPGLAEVPRERTGGGVHLVFRCRDLPASVLMAKSALVSEISETITAELFFAGLTIVLSPSVHASGHQYHWEVTGEIPLVSWADLQASFGFREKGGGGVEGKKRKKDRSWLADWKEDLRSLDLVAALEEADLLGECLDPDDHKWSVRCPWAEHHSGTADLSADSGTIVFNPPERLPAFKCLHAHCAERNFKSLVEWLEERKPGLVASHCGRMRQWEAGQENMDGRPRILLPGLGRPDSEFAAEMGAAIGPRKQWFRKGAHVCSVEMREITEKVSSLVFAPVQPVEAVTAAEKFVEPGILVQDDDGDFEFHAKSMSRECAGKLMAAPQFRTQLPEIIRILDIRLPIARGSEILFPEPGYDSRFRSYCPPDAPQPKPMGLHQAIDILKDVHGEFCWKDEQSVTHALARVITPYCRGLMGWDARFPLWHFAANRPRAGKDYLAGVTHLIYEGRTCEDAPLDRDSEETRKRITAAMMSGRRIMHFANCQGHIQDAHFIGAITSKTFAARNLGSTEAKADLVMPNEIEFSLSANVGLTFREDVEPRTRRIALQFYDENPNGRSFTRPDLHGWVLENRPLLLGAVSALVQHWINQGCPPGPTPFNSFPEWSRVVGGIMTSCGLPDPCLPHEHVEDLGGDRQERAMRAVFRIGFDNHPDAWIEKSRLFELLEAATDCDELTFFAQDGDLSSRSAKVRIGKALRQFRGRHLEGIQLLIEDNAKSERQRVMFTQPAPTNPIDLDHLLRGEVGDVGEVHTLQKVSEPSEEKSEWCEKSTVHRESIDAHHRSPQPPHPPRESIFCTDLKDLERVAKALAGEHRIALDLETYGPKKGGALDPFRGDIRLLTVAGHRGPVWMLDLKTLGYELGPLKTVLEGAEIAAHNAKFDLLWLRVKCGVNPRKVVCTMTASRLLTAGLKRGHKLNDCLWRHLQIEPGKDLGHSDWGAMMLSTEQFAYASRDVAHLHDLAGTLEHEIEISGLDEVWMLERQLLPCVVDMEAAGIGVDRGKLEVIVTEQSVIAEQAADDLRAALGAPSLNLASPLKLLKALQEAGLKLKSTRAEDLKRVEENPLVPLLLRHRTAKKRVEQAEALIKHVAADGRIHGRFEPTGTATGRFSSKNPNLQNIGRGDLREAFVAGPGRRLVVADYSQIELRAAAAIANEPKMIQAYKDGTDLHALTAAAMQEIDMAEVTKDQRQMAKAINFGNLYGQGDEGLARYARNSYGVDMSVDEAHRFRLKFFKTYPALKVWHGKAWQHVDQCPEWVKTCIGRRRLIPRDASNWDCFTALVNTPIQGSTADGIKYAIVLLSERLPEDARIVSTVHDELVVECPEQDAEAIRTLMIDTMTEAMSDLFPEIPIEVEASIGKSWAEK